MESIHGEAADICKGDEKERRPSLEMYLAEPKALHLVQDFLPSDSWAAENAASISDALEENCEISLGVHSLEGSESACWRRARQAAGQSEDAPRFLHIKKSMEEGNDFLV